MGEEQHPPHLHFNGIRSIRLRQDVEKHTVIYDWLCLTNRMGFNQLQRLGTDYHLQNLTASLS